MASGPVLDLPRLVAPISADQPAGADLRWDPLYQAIKDARSQTDRDMLSGGEPVVINWAQVVDLSTDALTTKSKDLMIAGWLTEGLTYLHGFAGLRDGLTLIAQLLEVFWEHLYPLPEGSDLEPRVAPLVWLTEADRGARLPNSVRDLRLFPDSEVPCSWNYWKARFPQPKGAAEKDAAFEQRRKEAEEKGKLFEEAVGRVAPQAGVNLHQDLLQTIEALARFNKVCDERFGALSPGTSALRQALDECEALVRRIVKDKGGLPAETAGSAEGNGEVQHAPPRITGPIQTREEAFQRLAEAAIFLRQTEPQSPVSYLIERAVAWGQMPFEQLLTELIKDNGVRGQVGELLGIKGAPPPAKK
jgi:type VI secretion system protein ImpA